MTSSYVGRFAPTPSGPLHLGSIIAALGSYLLSKIHNGAYLIRIEDLDYPRCNKEYTVRILDTLNKLCIKSDKKILYQSDDLSVYEDACTYLLKKGYAFYCNCNREKLKSTPCTCYKKDLDEKSGYSLRFYHKDLIDDYFLDEIKGKVYFKDKNLNNFIALKRSDGIYSYNLAVVVDDIRQGINHIVRGSDLLDVTAIQNALYKAFLKELPSYAHLPLALDINGNKISKQNHAKDILSILSPQKTLKLCLNILGQDSFYVDDSMSCSDTLDHAITHFDINKIIASNVSIRDLTLYK